MLATKPVISKTIVKGTIIIFIFSLFLDISRLISFLIFLGIVFTTLFLYAFWKRIHTYIFDENGIIIQTPFSRKFISYSIIDDAFISVGFLAKRFHCGSVYLILKTKKVEIIRDIPNPDEIFELLKKKIV
ncbi:PH domain-containing protein [Sulfurisphaera javensis]|uniref:PH domain-containing protein n=1 Tax=Sulfurisphaera javensis TaxID=2049879 RepID=A0AAT9GQQ9_9CREN